MMDMTLSVDHRIIDGATAAKFLQDIVRVVANPSLLMW
jgi:pyruvate/2-oxoglutarate dehydrogenase complex dihydrolipoamide acyltransferase (E2) component